MKLTNDKLKDKQVQRCISCGSLTEINPPLYNSRGRMRGIPYTKLPRDPKCEL